MKTDKNTVQAPTLPQEVQRVIESAPSRAKLADAAAKLESLWIHRNGASTALAALEKRAAIESAAVESAATRVIPWIAENAKALLERSEVPGPVTSDELCRARLTLRTVESAVRIQEREVQSLMSCVAREVRCGLRPCRQRLIVRVAAALKEIEAVAAEEAEIVSAVSKGRVDVNLVGYLSVLDLGRAEAWLSARKAEGYEI